MRHLYECPMRWADLDMLGHVNNVVYADYLQEARVDLLRLHSATGGQTDRLAEGVVVVSHRVQYVAPLLFDLAGSSVSVEVWVTEIRAASFTLAYEVFQQPRQAGEERTVFLRATSVLTPYVFATEQPRRLTAEERAGLEAYLEPADSAPAVEYGQPRRTEAGHYPLRVRFSDLDAYGHVNNVKFFEYFQEARIAAMGRMRRDLESLGPVPSMVVAQTDVDYLRPVHLRAEPYDVHTWISRVGTRSVTMSSEILDGEATLARARCVLVFFDTATGRSVVPPDALREVLSQLSG
ncbi:MAG TPA: thioesterase family protein [Nocardioides sp.]|uniref:acyl-CoA thioesterase n=1 Tax=Nocardioides sp. TaxID=35761 RepID=UPI002ED9DEC4